MKIAFKTDYTPEEQKANRKIWVEALRSGEYKQGIGALKDRQGNFCCLGVACDLIEGVEWIPPTADTDKWQGFKLGEIRQDTTLKSTDIRNVFGISTQWGAFINPETKLSAYLTEMNDNEGKSFSEIADIIESEPVGLITGTHDWTYT